MGRKPKTDPASVFKQVWDAMPGIIREAKAKRMAVAFEITGVSRADLDGFANAMHAPGFDVTRWPLPRGHAVKVVRTKGKYGMSITLTTEED